MKIATTVRTIAVGFVMLMTGLVIDSWILNGVIITDAEARVVSFSHVLCESRVCLRGTRRAIRRTSIYAASLPTGCTTVIIEGTSLYQCGGTYYQSHNNQYVVVNVD